MATVKALLFETGCCLHSQRSEYGLLESGAVQYDRQKDSLQIISESSNSNICQRQ
jgi:hypothetical protein